MKPGAIDRLPLVVSQWVGISSITLSAVLAIAYSGQHILEAHSFRQTQTALTSFWLSRTGFKLAYETPVGGYPWSIPFEFPLYELLVAKISSNLNLGLEQVGRLVSYLFLLGCLLPVRNILKRLFPGSCKLCFWVFTSLFLTSPLYLFWGRAFLMETTALFFTLCFLQFAIAILRLDVQWRHAALSFVFLTLAILQKATTALPLLFVVITILIVRIAVSRPKLHFVPLISKLLVAFVAPLILGCVWMKYSDWVKSQNALGLLLTSSALFHWNFGALLARLAPQLWVDVIWKRAIVKSICGLSCAAVALGAYFLRGKERTIILLCMITFLLYFLIFENLHFTHDYYQVANGVFFILAAAVAISGFLQMPGKRAAATLVFFLLAAGTNLALFRSGYYRAEIARFDETTNDVLRVSSIIRNNTDQERPILVYGDDWSSDIAFFSQRKSFTVPRFFSPYTGPIRSSISYLGKKESALVLCGPEQRLLWDDAIQSFAPAKIVSTHNCTVFFE